jgi:recombination protein RecT
VSNLQRAENVKQIVMMAGPDFNQLAKIHGAVNFQKEASFALQILKGNDYLAGVAMGDPDSLKSAILNVASIGLSLSPVFKHAYLVPRNKKVCLDISYRGLIQLAVDVGSIKWAKAEIVCEKDVFKLRGLGQEPVHEFEPFGEGGKVVGAYCVAKTHDGDYLTTTMTIGEIYSIRDRSESFKSGKGGPWTSDETEMIRKTVIRRAYKSWPLTNTRQRLDAAIDVSNEIDPIDFNTPQIESPKAGHRDTHIALIRDLLTEIGRTEEKYIEHLCRTTNRTIKTLDDLTEIEMSQAITMLKALPKKKVVPNENAS